LPTHEKFVLIYSTYSAPAEAERIGEALIDLGLAACVNILPAITSIYVWEGKRQKESETAMLIKTREALIDKVIAEVRAQHSYDNPALLVLPIVDGSRAFLDWIATETADRG
jgi:periplasmic divalent cation tolerance protein